jgi:hypothetical protein
MGFILRQIVVDQRGLGRIVELVFDILDLRDLRQFRDIECALVESDTVRAIEAGSQNLDAAFAVLAGDGIDLVNQPASDKHSALVAFADRPRIRHAGRIDLNVESGR